jgi:ABC-type glycerol-3-phosphate transport system substrate-binding protein
LSPESQLLDAKIAGTLPVRKSVYADPWFKTKDAESLVQWKTYIEQYGRTMRYPEKFSVLQEWLAEAAQQIVVKGDPIKKTLDDVAARWNAEIGK